MIISDLGHELAQLGLGLLRAAAFLIGYVVLILLLALVWRLVKRMLTPRHDFTSLKTVTFGDESAVRPDRWASVISVITIFLIWGAFTGSKWVPIHAPGPFIGDTEFTYTLEAPDGTRDDATVMVRVSVEVADWPGNGTSRGRKILVGFPALPEVPSSYRPKPQARPT